MEYKRGSEWRKWDLHIHTASSYIAYKGNDANQLLVEAWRKHEFSAVAITDHFIIDKRRIKELKDLAPEITIFPGVELRTDKGAANLHVIIIFSEKINIDDLADDFEAIMLRGKAKAKESPDTIYWDFNDIVEFSEKHNGIISLHVGKKDKGLDKEITNAAPVNMAIKEEISEYYHIFEIGKLVDIETYHKYVFNTVKEKPLILCSDNHDPRDYKVKEYLWVKADPTFEGLLQTILIPSERVYVGNIPQKLDIVNKRKSSYIKSLTIQKEKDVINKDENWFNVEQELNTGLIAIIGNKGSGKSALADIIGLTCKCKSNQYASFLHENRFKSAPEYRAKDYYAAITWLDNKCEEKINLFDVNNELDIENAQFLPQRYIEEVCNDLNGEFQDEINKVIFSYVDTIEKGDAKTLDQLIQTMSSGINHEITSLKSKIEEKNREIIKLEDMLAPSYKASLTQQLEKRKEDLKRHEENKPGEISRPEAEKSKEIQEQVEQLNKIIKAYEENINNTREKIKNINMQSNELTGIKEQFLSMQKNVEEWNNYLSSDLSKKYGFSDKEFIISMSLPMEILMNKLEELDVEKSKLACLLDESNDKSLCIQKKKNEDKKQAILSQISAEERAYHIYINDLNEWEKERNTIIGTDSQDNSISYLEKEVRYVSDKLPDEYITKIQERDNLIKLLYNEKIKIADIYKKIYKPVEEELAVILCDIEDKIEFDVDISLTNSSLGSQLLEYINQGMKGIFYGKNEGNAEMRENISKTNFNSLDSVLEFIHNIYKCVDEDLDSISKKIKNRLEFYNKLCSLEYINAEYILKLGGRELRTLSPGERGIVLLVFYLALNKDKMPLLIDQPEDNLDNQSVYDKLVPCIISAKKRRQVIIVTHNPNIAVACDAEQIICCQMDKIKNEIRYISGSIEDDMIRQNVIDILEGTMPAFDLRRLKYTYGNRAF